MCKGMQGEFNLFDYIKEARLSMMSVAPALLFVPIIAAYREYFQGMQNRQYRPEGHDNGEICIGGHAAKDKFF